MEILRLITSFRGKDSQSFQLGNFIVQKLMEQEPRARLLERNLVKDEIPHLGQVHFTAFATPTQDLSDELKEAIAYSNTATAELLQADILVIDVPMYNFGIPSALKAWIDQVVRAGITFRYTEKGVEGLVRQKKVYLAIASGGIYSQGNMKAYDHTEPYLTDVLGFIGITDITTFRVEGLGIPDVKETAVEKAIQAVEEAFVLQ